MEYLKHQTENPTFLNNYLKFKEFIEFKPETTTNAYYYDLRTFFRFVYLKLYDKDKLKTITKEDFRNICINQISLDDLNKVDRNMIIEYVMFLGNVLENDGTTENRKLTSVKRLFQYLSINNFTYDNPTLGLSKIRLDKRLPDYLTLEESKKLLSTTINSTSKNVIRNYAIICLFLNTGIRLSELVGINISNIKFDEKTMKVLGKGNKERIVYLDEASIESIKAYLDIRPKLNITNKDYDALFLSNRNKRISRRSVETIIKEETQNAFDDNKDDIHTHSLRHTCATLLFDKSKADTLTLKVILGHQSIESTSIYTHVSSKELREIMNEKSVSVLIQKFEEEK